MFWVLVFWKTLLLLFSHSVMSDSLQPHGLQHTRPPCPSPSPGVCSNSCPLSGWCHSTISSSVIHFSSCLQSSQHQGLFQQLCLNQPEENISAIPTILLAAHMCAKFLQSYPTLCNPMDCSLSGFSVHGISQTRILELGCHFLLQGTFPTQGLSPHLMSPALAGRFFTTSTT